MLTKSAMGLNNSDLFFGIVKLIKEPNGLLATSHTKILILDLSNKTC